MTAVQFHPSAAALAAASQSDKSAAQLTKPPLALEIRPVAPFDFAYTKVRLDTGEAVRRWPRETPFEARPNAVGDIVDIVA
jgi:hypothetical protein